MSDVCRVLSISNPRNVAARLDDDEKGMGNVDTPGGKQQLVLVNESGLYAVVLTSRKPAAKRLRVGNRGTAATDGRRLGSRRRLRSQERGDSIGGDVHQPRPAAQPSRPMDRPAGQRVVDANSMWRSAV